MSSKGIEVIRSQRKWMCLAKKKCNNKYTDLLYCEISSFLLINFNLDINSYNMLTLKINISLQICTLFQYILVFIFNREGRVIQIVLKFFRPYFGPAPLITLGNHYKYTLHLKTFGGRSIYGQRGLTSQPYPIYIQYIHILLHILYHTLSDMLNPIVAPFFRTEDSFPAYLFGLAWPSPY